jgi:hypothetical protein
VVLGSEHNVFHAGILGELHPLFGIEFLGIEFFGSSGISVGFSYWDWRGEAVGHLRFAKARYRTSAGFCERKMPLVRAVGACYECAV